jgi:hypothetical protein
MTAPSKVLVDPISAPGGLTCDVEFSVGQNWQEMSGVKMGATA